MMDGWLTVTQYAELTGRHFMTVGEYARSGRLSAVRQGQRWYIHKDTPWPTGGVPARRRKPQPPRRRIVPEAEQKVLDLAAQMLSVAEVAKRTGLTEEAVRAVLRQVTDASGTSAG